MVEAEWVGVSTQEITENRSDNSALAIDSAPKEITPDPRLAALLDAARAAAGPSDTFETWLR